MSDLVHNLLQLSRLNYDMNPERRVTYHCLRCSIEMDFLGTYKFPDHTNWTASAPIDDNPTAVIYVCPLCRKVEFFLPEPHPPQSVVEEKRPFIPDFAIEVSPSTLLIAPDPIDLLKLKPGESMLADVYQTVGHPTQFHTLERGIALCYPSETENAAQIVLINRENKSVDLVTIYNHAELFTLEALEQAYGLRELAGVINGNEHWFFEGHGVAFVVEGRNDHDIMYLQLFKPTMRIDDYQNVDGYSSETFIC